MNKLRASYEHDLKAQRGLPEALPKDERILWQGSPDARLLARRVFHTRKLILYFAALLLIRGAFVLSDTGDLWLATKAVLWVLPVFAFAWTCILWFARLTASTTVYTITDKRVVMRIGIVLSLTFNLPFKQIQSAGLHLLGGTVGDIPLEIAPPNRLAYLNFWPHVRPWRITATQPMLRCVPNISAVAEIFANAWTLATGQERNAQSVPTPLPQLAPHEPARQPRTRPASGSPLAGAA